MTLTGPVTEWENSLKENQVSHKKSLGPVTRILVREDETGVVILNGQISKILPPGIHTVHTFFKKGEIMWISHRKIKTHFQAKAFTSDNIEITVRGTTLMIVDINIVKNFVTQFLSQQSTTIVHLQDWFKESLQAVVRSHLMQQEIAKLYARKEEFSENIRKSVEQQMKEFGMQLSTIEISDVEIPDEVKNMLQEDRIETIRSQITTKRNTTSADSWKRFKDSGFNPMQIQAIEALQQWSSNPGSASPPSPVITDLFVPLMFMNMMKGSGVTDLLTSFKESGNVNDEQLTILKNVLDNSDLKQDIEKLIRKYAQHGKSKR